MRPRQGPASGPVIGDRHARTARESVARPGPARHGAPAPRRRRWRRAAPRDLPGLARRAGVARVHAKDERGRMGLGSFKSLGAAHAIARAAAGAVAGDDWAHALSGEVFVTASAGNHGLSVAAGARIFGARAVIYLSEAVPESFARRLADKGAESRRGGPTYADSMAEIGRASC